VYHREGRYPVALPFVIGQEGAGVISAVAAEVRSIKAGDQVVTGPFANVRELADGQEIRLQEESRNRRNSSTSENSRKQGESSQSK